MAEALGAASAVAGLLSLSGKILAEGYDFISTVHRAPKELRDLLKEVASLSTVLDQLSSLSDETLNPEYADARLKDLAQAGQIRECEESLLLVRKSIEKCQAVKGEQVKNLGRRMLWPFKEKETKETLVRLARIRGHLTTAVTVDVATKLQGVSITTKETAAGVNELRDWTVMQDQLEERRALIKWLNPNSINVEDNLKEALKHRHPKTGKWLFKTDIYSSWSSGPSSVLWIHGIPGSGKTVIASTVIETLFSQVPSSTAAVYFFCDQRDSNKQELPQFLAVGINQLLNQHADHTEVVELFRHYRGRGIESISSNDLRTLFSRMSKKFSVLYVVIDALDECKNPDEFVQGLRSLIAVADTVRMLITGRNNYSLDRLVGAIATHRIVLEQNIANDIKAFVTFEVDARIKARKLKIRSADLRERIVEDLSRYSDGMFLWAAFQLDLICRLTNDKAIREALHRLPRGLENTYIRLFEHVKDANADSLEIVVKALTWIGSAITPLTLSQLAEAISVEPGDEERDPEKIINDENDLLEMLGSLVTVDTNQNDPIVSLAHFTLYEFLRSDALQNHESVGIFYLPYKSVFDVGVRCVQYLSFTDFCVPCQSRQELDDRRSSYPLLVFAAQNWFFQARSYRALGPGIKDMLPFLAWFIDPHREDGSKNFLSWQQVFHDEVNESRLPQNPISYAIRLNAVNLFPFLLQRADDARELLKQGYTAFHIAIITSDEEKVAKMLATGWNVDDLASNAQTPLHLAAGYGHEAIVKLLLDEGASIHARSSSGSTPFYRSVRSGSIPTMELLYLAGSDLNAETWDGWTPIFEAVENVETPAIEWLIKRGAKLNHRLWKGPWLVEFARKAGSREVTRLIEAGLSGKHI